MASLLSHPAVPLALGCVLGRERLSARFWLLGAAASIAPDLDVIAFPLGIPYGAPFGHRGATHSIVFAALVAVFFTLRARRFLPNPRLLFAFLFASALSHPLLDMLTDGGRGIALFWPASNARIFFPWRPIAVSPIGAAFFSAAGLRVLASELVWIWLPCVAIASVAVVARKSARRFPPDRSEPVG